MKNAIISLLGFTFLFVSSMAQSDGILMANTLGDPQIEELLELHIAYNKQYPTMPGYRIQIFMESGNQGLSRAKEVGEEFKDEFSDIPVYILFSAPYYRVRVGDFRTRLEGENALQKISRDYPNAWVIQDVINFPEININQNKNNYE